AEQAVQELAGRRANPDAIRNTLGTRVRDVLRKRNSSFAVVMPIVSVKPRDDSNIYEKEFF
ncbi:MAG: hypothetical protein II832_06555, partial [Synergistaceae bacterium]|nr:hypothetical protein [Synergistaceae bacterium]